MDTTFGKGFCNHFLRHILLQCLPPNKQHTFAKRADILQVDTVPIFIPPRRGTRSFLRWVGINVLQVPDIPLTPHAFAAIHEFTKADF